MHTPIAEAVWVFPMNTLNKAVIGEAHLISIVVTSAEEVAFFWHNYEVLSV